MSSSDRGGEPDPGGREESLADLLWEYVDRLNAGEVIDPAVVRAEHPDLASELLLELQALKGWIPGEPGPPEASSLGTLGDYTLRRQIGRGGMGVVYEAWENSMDRMVALKVLPPGIAADERALQRFVREARTAGQLNHPSVVAVYGMGLKEQTPYFAMEFVEGETLAQVLAKLKEHPDASTPFGHARDDQEFYLGLARAFADVADGLQHAHSKGIIHRDIKPSNLILDKDGRLRILDFGLARLEGKESLTISGDLVGTPQYMSPEQARRKKIPVDHRTDVYSLGATLYEMLALQPPFRGKDHNDTLSQIIERDPVEPRKVNPRVPKDLETIVLKCLRKDAGDRYGTAEAMGQDLRRFGRGDAVEARAEGRWERFARKSLRQRRKIAAASVVGMAFVVLVGQAIVWRTAAHEKTEIAYQERVLGAALQLEMASLIQMTRAGEHPFYGMGTGSSRRLARPSKVDPVGVALKSLEMAEGLVPEHADARYHRARALILLGREKEAQEVLAALISARRPFLPAMTLKAEILERRGEREASATLLKNAERFAAQSWEKLWLQIARNWKLQKAPELMESYTQLLDLAANGRDPFIGCTLLARLGRGQASLAANDFVEALKEFSTAENLTHGAPLPAILAGRTWLALDRKVEADRVFQRLYDRTDHKDEVAAAVWGIYVFDMGNQDAALEWARRILVPSATLSRQARTLFNLGRYPEAEDAGRRAVEADPADIDALEHLGFIWIQLGKQREAREMLAKGLEVHPDSFLLVDFLGWSYMKDPGRDIDRAISFHLRSLELEDRRELHPFAWAYLSQCYFWKGDEARALEAARKAMETASEDADVINIVGLAMLRAGKLLKGTEAFERAIALAPLESWYLNNKGYALYLDGKLDEALAVLRSAQRLLPKSPHPHLNAGRALELQGKVNEALSEYLRAIQIDPAHREAQGLLQHLLREQGPRLGYESLREAVEVLGAAVEATRGTQPDAALLSASLALALASRGEGQDFERALEVLRPALEGGGGGAAADVHALEAFRRVLERLSASAVEAGPLGILPTLPSYQAIDVGVHLTPDALSADDLLVKLRPTGGDLEARERYLFLEGSLLSKRGNASRAIASLEELVRIDAASAEPILLLTEILRQDHQLDRAEDLLLTALKDARARDRRIWDHWLAVETVDLKRSPAEVASKLPDAGTGEAAEVREAGYRDDVLWLLRALESEGAIRINCGGGEHRDPNGKLWGKDRFALGGVVSSSWAGPVNGTSSAPLYLDERDFPLQLAGPLSTYAIPLPPGKYRVQLHFAEVTMNIKGFRRFDVLLEGERALEGFEPIEAGFATAVVKTFDVRVDDGLLEIRFVHRPPRGPPKVSAIEVERLE